MRPPLIPPSSWSGSRRDVEPARDPAEPHVGQGAGGGYLIRCRPYRQLERFGKVFDLVRADYVDKPDVGKLIDSAINGMLTGLDPHSSYMDAKSYRELQTETAGEFGGLGMEVTLEDGLIKVVAPVDDTPAAKAGIQANDVRRLQLCR